MQITWLGHASFKIKTKENFVIYIDPFAGDDSEYQEPANLILVSHEGYHHLGYEKIRLIRVDATHVLANEQSAYELNGTSGEAGREYDYGPVKVKPVNAYSLRPGVGLEKGKGFGFKLLIEGKIIYFAGTTDLIPEMEDIVCDVALLPVSGTRTLGPSQALEAVKRIRPKVAVPMYYGLHAGTIEDAELFKEITEQETSTKVEILEEGGSLSY